MKALLKPFLLSAATLLGVLTLSAQAPYRTQPEALQQNHDHRAEIDPSLLLAAKDALTLFKNKEGIFVDVRSRFEYNAEHIQNAISFPYKAISMTNRFPFPKDKKLILYCGCPHHLSGMSAEILRKQGYSHVKVINEGYWGWKLMGYPIVQGPPEARKRISQSINGRLVDARQQPVAYRDVFVEHLPTGQLEATRTDAEGRFRMQLHFAAVAPGEKLAVGLSHRTLARLSLAEMKKPLQLRLPLETALKQ